MRRIVFIFVLSNQGCSSARRARPPVEQARRPSPSPSIVGRLGQGLHRPLIRVPLSLTVSSGGGGHLKGYITDAYLRERSRSRHWDPVPELEAPNEAICPMVGTGMRTRLPGRAAGLRRRCQRAAEHIRNLTGIAHDEKGRQGWVEDRPWPRLLLWVFACAALVVSLVIRADGLDDRDPRSAVRAAATKENGETGLPVLSSIPRRGEAGASFLKSEPRG
jgi:hypothetical protein